MWSSCAAIKSTAASIKKFYMFLLEGNIVTQEEYDTVLSSIKEDMPEWLEKMRQYENMAEDFF